MGNKTEKQPEFELTGGDICLDLANTLSDRPRCRTDRLPDYTALLQWCEQAGVLDPAEVKALAREAERRPEQARAAFRRVIEFRECVYRLFARLAADQAPADADLDELNRGLTRALPRLQVRRRSTGLEWQWSAGPRDLDRMLWPVMHAAAQLLTQEPKLRVGECDSATCSWLFVDRSRGRRRRWCEMKSCGNRAKARRHYARKKTGKRVAR